MVHRVDRSTVIGAVVTIAILAVAPLVIYPIFVMKLMCYALFAAAFNLLLGYAGLLSFGHAAFLGTGAYITAHVAKVWGFDPLMSILCGSAVACILGFIMGLVAIRRKGIEFSMITLALAQLVAFAAHELPFTGGENGIQEVPRGQLFGLVDLNVTSNMYSFVLVICGLGMFVLWRTVNSPFGHVLQAIRDHEIRAMSIGYNVAQYKLTAFTISAALAGIAGGLKALIYQIATLDDVSFHLSGEVILIVLLGGVGRFFGPLVGAAIIVSLESFLATSSLPAPVLTGTVFIACVLVFRRGIVGEIATRLNRN